MSKKEKILSVDIETACGIDCGLTLSKCFSAKHGLIPHENRITVIGTWGPEEDDRRVFRGEDIGGVFSTFLRKKCEGEGYRLLGQNFSFDLKVLSYHLHNYTGSYLDYWGHDTQLLAYVMTQKIPEWWLKQYNDVRQELNKELPKGISHRKASKHSLKTLAPYFLDDVEPFWEDPTNHDSDDYVLRDCEYTYRLHEELLRKASPEEVTFYYDKQLPWAKELLKAELRGAPVDMVAMNKEKKVQAIIAQEKEALVRKQWGISDDFNLNSPKQLLELFQSRGYDATTYDGKDSTDKEVLNKLVEQGHADVETFLDYRKASKLVSTYFPSYERYVVNGRIHASFNSTGTRTGRISSSDPNLQNQPPVTRKFFRATEGKILITRDLSGVEPVLMAYYSHDPSLLEIVLDPEQNFHSAVTPLVFPYVDCPNKDVKKLFKKERDVTKTADLAIFYGSGARRLHQIMTKAGFADYTLADCKYIVKKLRSHFSGVWQFKEALDEELQAGSTIYNLLGRPVKIDDPDDVYMKGFNRLIQGSGSDIVMEAIRRYNAWAALECPESQVILTVHDEIVVEAPEDRAEECDAKLDFFMIDFDLTREGVAVKLETEGMISKTWEK